VPDASPLSRLAPRERDCVSGILRGYSNKEIAHRYGISAQTVKNTLSRVYRKVGVSSRLELAAYAARRRHVP
jgi:DNA-binding CsgD family transcriptional regulator